MLLSKNQPLGLPVVDAAIGLFGGIPLGLTNVGGVDLLVNAAYVPTVRSRGRRAFAIAPAVELQVRLRRAHRFASGISDRPGYRRHVHSPRPADDVDQRTSNFVDINVDNVKAKTSAWRVVANKNFIGFGIAAGYGRDTYDESTTVSGTVKNDRDSDREREPDVRPDPACRSP